MNEPIEEQRNLSKQVFVLGFKEGIFSSKHNTNVNRESYPGGDEEEGELGFWEGAGSGVTSVRAAGTEN
jgi:hypothetical protein